MPRTLLAFIAGGGLALAGLLLQTVTRNPTRRPLSFWYIVRCHGGGSDIMALAGTTSAVAGVLSLSSAAFVDALVAMAILLLVAGSALGRQVESMLLGVLLCHFYLVLLPVSPCTGAIHK